MTQASEVVYSKSRKVSCDGGAGALGHPKVYLEIAPHKKDIVCPYCSKKFVLEAGAEASHDH